MARTVIVSTMHPVCPGYAHLARAFIMFMLILFSPYIGQCFIICSCIGLVGPIFIHFCLLIINLIKLTPLKRRSLFHFYRLKIVISLFIVVVLFVVLFLLFVCLFLCWGLISLFNH